VGREWLSLVYQYFQILRVLNVVSHYLDTRTVSFISGVSRLAATYWTIGNETFFLLLLRLMAGSLLLGLFLDLVRSNYLRYFRGRRFILYIWDGLILVSVYHFCINHGRISLQLHVRVTHKLRISELLVKCATLRLLPPDFNFDIQLRVVLTVCFQLVVYCSQGPWQPASCFQVLSLLR
jgi:hypothetical protein